MKNFPPALLCFACLTLCPVRGAEASEAPAPPPAAASKKPEAEPVPVPETIGVTVLAGVGFLMMFGRRRYS